MNQFQKWAALEGWERCLLLQVVVLLPTVAVGLRTIGYKRTLSFLGIGKVGDAPSDSSRPNEINLESSPDRIARVVSIATTKGPYRATCLPKALAMAWALQRRGHDPIVQIGVRKVGASIDAHAWVELEGAVFYEADDVADTYAALKRQANGDSQHT